MDDRQQAEQELLRLVLHDLGHCAALGETILRDAAQSLSRAVRNELVLCAAACGIAADSIRGGRRDLEALELCHEICRRCAEMLAPVGRHADLHLYARMTQLCSDSLQQLLYDGA